MKVHIHRIIRSQRKTCSLEIDLDGNLLVRAPEWASRQEIDRIVHRKHSWISRKQREAVDRRRKITPRRFVEGEEFLFLGKTYVLKLVDGTGSRGGSGLQLRNGCFLLSKKYLAEARKTFENWYRKQARGVLSGRVEHFTSALGTECPRVKVTGAMKRWGSCSSKGSLNFTWRLVLAPLHIVDYVVVHEVAHLMVKDHSRFFWKKVEDVIPDYKQKRKWLKENGHLLRL
ncbi:MAG: M48 family metallopeptidase [Spirochaetota bacterium]